MIINNRWCSSLTNLNADEYFIKNGYQCSSNINLTLDFNREEPYWNSIRLKTAKYHQYGVYWYAKELIRKYHLKSVLDIGCGAGIKLVEIIGLVCDDFTGIDQAGIIEYCKKHHSKGVFLVDDIENPELDLGRKFDLLISSDVIEHLVNPDALIFYIKKHSHSNTSIIFSTPERDSLHGKEANKPRNPQHIREWNKHEFQMYLKSRGFKVIDHRIIEHLKFGLNIETIRKLSLKYFKNYNTKHTQLIWCKLAQTNSRNL